ncbi:Xaa-Pro aminopeptidase [Capsulimonas corticalis]|uniref:Xaa-Pro aminopeptidase n=1 Tax=Capsulimonas corticalis TaxID=2219043 RepID=A0A402D6J3_9BACT|nr:aminopeptidase P N-terminal domain-containing protein [Capsulimonas corticalis]BDI32446.1 Xaa-Pro aminopeptidase [Capsulimonas corticalis]
MKKAYWTADEFAARREKVFDRIGSGVSAFLHGAGPVAGFELFRQTNDFYYLTGIEVPQSYLVMDGARRRSVLYVPNRDPHAANEGGGLGAEDADLLKGISGVDEVAGLSCLTDHLETAAKIFTPHSPSEGRLACQDTLRAAARSLAADPWSAGWSRDQRVREILAGYCPAAEIHDLSPILHDLRLIKSPRELEVMREAGAVCARAVAEAMRSTRPGVYEYQLGAVADYVYRMNDVRSEGYRPIIATAGNIWHAHYYQNHCLLEDGELVLMDYAPDIQNYTSDIGRMWPVNGRYDATQRELYGYIVEYHKTLLKYIRPGVIPRQILAEAAADMAIVIENTAFSKPIYEQAARRTLTFEGHLSHPVGMAVHDVGKYFDRPMEPGLVFALDPQMWIPEERLYVRVEDTVAVTENGVEALTSGAPLELREVEALIASRGLIQSFPMTLGDGVRELAFQ